MNNVTFHYGCTEKKVDVSDIAIDRFVRDGNIAIPSSISFNSIFGDVCPYVLKRLTIASKSGSISLPEKREADFIADIDSLKPPQKYSVIITSFECHGLGPQYLSQNLTALLEQTYRPLQIIVSDHSKNDDIEKMIAEKFVKQAQTKDIDLVYVRFALQYGNPCANWNNGAKYATGEFWHYFAMDDYFENATAIENVIAFANSNAETNWIACAHKTVPYIHRFIPRWHDNILLQNTISGPSAVVIRKKLHHIAFDPQFIFLLDLDWYYRLFLANNRKAPLIFPEITWCNRLHATQLSNTVCNDQLKKQEKVLLEQKYGIPLPETK